MATIPLHTRPRSLDLSCNGCWKDPVGRRSPARTVPLRQDAGAHATATGDPGRRRRARAEHAAAQPGRGGGTAHPRGVLRSGRARPGGPHARGAGHAHPGPPGRAADTRHLHRDRPGPAAPRGLLQPARALRPMGAGGRARSSAPSSARSRSTSPRHGWPGPRWSFEIFNLFGTVTVIVPESVDVSVSGGGMFASQVIQPHTAPPVPGAPKLRIHARGPGGTLYVRTKSS